MSHPDADLRGSVEDGLAAQRELNALAPELMRAVQEAYLDVVDHMRKSNGKLDRDFAVQSWYRVDAAFGLEKRLLKRVRRASAAAEKSEKTSAPPRLESL